MDSKNSLKRQIILENFISPSHQISWEELKKLSQKLGLNYQTLQSLYGSCGDTVYLLLKKQAQVVEIARFASEQQACCLTVAASNLLCRWVEKKETKLVQKEIENLENMLAKKNYKLANSSMKVFQDLVNFPQRIECFKLVLRGIKKILVTN